MQKTTLLSLDALRQRFPQFTFTKHEVFHWSPEKKVIYFNPADLKKEAGLSQLLHELGHALCNHTTYSSGVQLIKIEVEAWRKAQEIAAEYDMTIEQSRIDHCLDSYRDWLHLRSTCPECSSVAVETDANFFHCFNCQQQWKVPSRQQTRNYRLKQLRKIKENA